ncbi:hypothetical protein PENTCL1PPCAC_11573, partial [Pristionchus entomophagus]
KSKLQMLEEGQKTITSFLTGSAKKRLLAAPIFDDPKNSPRSTKKRRISREIEGQMALDAGQAKIGAQKCDKCDMVYSLDVEGDVVDHANRCNGNEKRQTLFVKRTILDTWVKRVLSFNPGHSAYPLTGECTVILKVDKKCDAVSLKTKVEEVVKNHVNVSLGFTEEGSMWDSKLSSMYSDATPSTPSTPSSSRSLHSSTQPRSQQRKAFMAIVRDNKGNSCIAGIVIVEAVCRAYDVDGEKMIRNKELMGVNRLWVNEEMMRKGIATKMVDAARQNFCSQSIPRSRVVFSEPTLVGQIFARRYVRDDGGSGGDGGGRLLVYSLANDEKWKETMKKSRRSQPITLEEKEEGENTVENEERRVESGDEEVS